MQDPTLELGDETEKIFLTPRGKADDISKGVKEFMEYVAENKVTSDFAKRLDDAVEAIKRGEGWRIEYMQLKEKMDKHYNAGLAEGRQEGRQEGLQEGRKEGRSEMIHTYITNCEASGKTPETIISELEKYFNYSAADAQAAFNDFKKSG